MSVATLLASLALGALQVPPRIVVVTESPLPQTLRDDAGTKSFAQTTQLFLDRGFERVDRGDTAYLFSPKLWARKELDDLVDLWQQTASAVKEDQSVDLASSPLLASYLSNGFGPMGYAGASSARLVLNTTSILDLTVGGVTKRVRMVNSETPEESEKLQQRPLKAQDPKVTKELKPVIPVGMVVPPPSLCVYSPGPRSLDPVSFMKETGTSSSILLARYTKALDAVKAARQKIFERAPSLVALDGVGVGSGYNEWPKALRDQLDSLFVQSYSRYGFRDSDEANLWLSRALVARTSTRFLVTASAGESKLPGGGPVYVSLGLP